jgi:hypothetical protein
MTNKKIEVVKIKSKIVMPTSFLYEVYNGCQMSNKDSNIVKYGYSA